MSNSELENRIKELELELIKVKSGNDVSGAYSSTSAIPGTEPENEIKSLTDNNEFFLNHDDRSFGHIAYINADTLKYEFVNVLYEKLFGIPREEIIGKHVRDILGESNYQFGLKYINQARSGKSVSYESNINLGTEERWLQINFSPVIEPSGHVISIAVLTHDITERKKSEQKLIESEDKLQKIITTTSEGYWLMNENGNFLDVNPAFCELIGYKKTELLAISISDLEAIESKVETELHIQKVLKQGNDRFESILRRKNGSLVNVEVNVSRLTITENQFFVFIHDITERKHAEEIITQQNEALSKLNHFAIELSKLAFEENLEEFIAKNVKEMSGCEVSIFSEYNSETRTTTTKSIEIESGMLKKVVKLLGTKVQKIHSSVNDEMYREMTGNIIGSMKTLYEASFGAISRPVGAAIQNLLKVDRFIGLAYIIDGKLYGTSLLAMKEDKPDPSLRILENFIHLAATALQRKQIEKQLKTNLDVLLNTNRRLEQFAHANEELEQFAFIASHNLQEPLRTVSNYVQIFEEDYSELFDNKAHGYLKVIDDAVKRMILLLDSLLDFSRLGRNLKLTKVNCRKLIDNVVADLETLAITSNSIIEVKEMPVLYVYESEFSQLFKNLIANAIKFQEKGNQPVIHIRSEKLKTAWKFSVSDNGIGIAPKYFPKIFDIFQRLHNKAEYQGNGIGLAFCKKIVQLHRGEIWVESVFGQGTTFHFTVANLTE